MSTEKMKSMLEDKPKLASFPTLLEQYKPEIAKALPKHLNADRMARIALTAFRKNPKLGECNPRSIFAAIIQASQLGLEPDTLGRSFLIPYKRECQFVPGWKGLMDLMNRSGAATAWTGAVFEGDEFDFALGDSPFVKHQPGDESDPELITHVYAIGRVNNASWPVIEVWTKKRVEKHRDRFNKVGRLHYSFQHFEMYARKVVLLQVLKYLPASFELCAAVALNDAAETGGQGLTVRDAIDGTWVPIDPEDESLPDPTQDINTTEESSTEEASKTAKKSNPPTSKKQDKPETGSGF